MQPRPCMYVRISFGQAVRVFHALQCQPGDAIACPLWSACRALTAVGCVRGVWHSHIALGSHIPLIIRENASPTTII